jgi:hypothetical protein
MKISDLPDATTGKNLAIGFLEIFPTSRAITHPIENFHHLL